MFEEADKVEFKPVIKGAEYHSASSEIWRIYKSGSRDEYFVGAIQRFDEKLRKGTAELLPVAMQLHRYFLKYAESLNLEE